MHPQDHIYVLEKENGAFMTAEIAIMNKEAIALQLADSATQLTSDQQQKFSLRQIKYLDYLNIIRLG